ncbi:glycoside hydrolase [Actinomycetes bacterium KLBMP 9797]
MRARYVSVVAAVVALVVPLSGQAAQAAPTDGVIMIDRGTVHQVIDGFGVSQAFQRASLINGARGLSPQKQREVLDLLFSQETGAGLSILRLGIGSSADDPYDLMKSIQPVDPGGPNAPPRYEWDGYDGGQVWLAQQAKAYGVTRFYADAWSAPGYMKTNGTDNNGGSLCGLAGAECASGDWRTAYANYLVQYAKFYAQEGIRITDLGFTNEPDWTASYASMRFTPAQAVEFTKVLGPIANRAGLKLVCCDTVGWAGQRTYTEAIEADPDARKWVKTHAGHMYGSAPTSPLPTTRRTWMSEWSPNGTTWNEAWDDGSGYDGLTVANAVHDALTLGNVNGYVYWLGASLGATRAFLQIASEGDAYQVSKRLWAFAAYSRFIRPGAVRVDAVTGVPGLKVSAYRNADGTRVIEALNTGTSEVTVDLNAGAGAATSYRTDEAHSLAPTDAVSGSGQARVARLAPRALTTIVIDPQANANGAA